MRFYLEISLPVGRVAQSRVRMRAVLNESELAIILPTCFMLCVVSEGGGKLVYS